MKHDNCELCTDHQEKVIIDLDEEDELFINNQSDIWEEEKDKNHCPEQEEDTQSDDGSIIIITMAELEEEKRKIRQYEYTDSGRKIVTPTCQSLLEPLRGEKEENSGIKRIKIRKNGNTNADDDVVSITWSETSEDPNETSGNSELKGEKWMLPHEKYTVHPLPRKIKNDDTS